MIWGIKSAGGADGPGAGASGEGERQEQQPEPDKPYFRVHKGLELAKVLPAVRARQPPPIASSLLTSIISHCLRCFFHCASPW